MLNVSLDEEAEKYLVEILSQERTTSNELIKKLLRNHLQSVSATKSVLERMGGVPQHLLCVGNLSERNIRREIIADRIRADCFGRYMGVFFFFLVLSRFWICHESKI